MNYVTYDCCIGDLQFKFRDIETSNTVPIVVDELVRNDYGLADLQLKETDTFVDVGANVGAVSIYVKKKFGCKVIAFEPSVQNIENFKANIQLNGFKPSDFEIHQKAVTGKDGDIVNLDLDSNNMGNCNIINQNSAFSHKVGTITLGRFLTPDVKYLKIDCEASEYEIIPTIKDKLENVEYIGIEFHRAWYDQDPIELHRQLRETFKGKMFISAWDFETNDLETRLKQEDLKYI